MYTSKRLLLGLAMDSNKYGEEVYAGELVIPGHVVFDAGDACGFLCF